MSCTAHHFWRGTCVIGHRWEGEGASSLGPRMYPTAPCLVLPAPWLSSDSPPSSRWGHRAGSTSNLSAGSGENNRGGCDKVQWENKRGGGGRANSGITTSLSWCVVVWQSVGGEQLVWGGRQNISFYQKPMKLKSAWQVNTDPWWPVIAQEEI